MKELPSLYYSGTSGLVLPLRQKDFPPEHAGVSRLTYYASLFNSIEINSTFYKLPKAATVAKWAESVPSGFQFTFKVPKIITHNKGFSFEGKDVENFMSTVAHIGDRKGCLLIQLPPSITNERFYEVEHLLSVLKDLDEDGEWKVAIELRNQSWYNRATYDMLRRYDVVLVAHDMPACATPHLRNDGPAHYLRFHGVDGKYRGSYTMDELEPKSGLIKELVKKGIPVYTYFNNTMGDALANLQQLNAMVLNGKTGQRGLEPSHSPWLS